MGSGREKHLIFLGMVFSLLAAPALVGCGGGGGGGGSDATSTSTSSGSTLQAGYYHHAGEDCITCHTTWNVVELHKSTSALYNGDCVTCHGYRLEDESLSSSVPGFHSKMIPYVLADAGQTEVNNTVCKYCHQSVDILGDSAGALRKQVAVDASAGSTTCVSCHTAGGESSKEFYK